MTEVEEWSQGEVEAVRVAAATKIEQEHGAALQWWVGQAAVMRASMYFFHLMVCCSAVSTAGPTVQGG